MAMLPADDDYAHSVLTIFRARHLRARQTLSVSDVRAQFLTQGLGFAPDFIAAIAFAVESGWLTLEGDRLRLSVRGFDEAA